MDTLIIESEPTPHQKNPSLIFAHKQGHFIELTGRLAYFSPDQFNQLAQWIEEYAQEDLPTLNLRGYWWNAIYYPESATIFKKYKKYQFEGRAFHLHRALANTLGRFNWKTEKGNCGNNGIPHIICNIDDQFMRISGRYILSDVYEIAQPLFAWLEVLFASKPSKIRIEFFLEYFNTSASRVFHELSKGLEVQQKQGCEIAIYWYYQEGNEDLEEAGHDFDELTTLSVNVLPISDSQLKQFNQ